MKKVILILLCCAICEHICAYSNTPIFPEDVQKYWLSLNENATLIDVLHNLVGDTLQISHSPVAYYDKNYSSGQAAFLKITPDTIWIKQRPKNNIEGKNFFLEYAFKYTDDVLRYYPNSNIYRKAPTRFESDIVISSIIDSMSCSFVDLKTGEKGIWYPHKGEYTLIESKNIEQKIQRSLAKDNLYYKTGNKKDTIVNHDIKYGSSITELQLSNICICYKIENKKISSKSYITCTIKNSKTTDVRILTLDDQFDKYNKQFSNKQFISKEEVDSIDQHRNQLAIYNQNRMNMIDSSFVTDGYAAEYTIKAGGSYQDVRVYIFSYLGSSYECGIIYKNKEYWLHSGSISFSDSNAKSYLFKRGKEGMEIRKQNAFLADKQYWQQIYQQEKHAKDQQEKKRKELMDLLNKGEYFLIESPSPIEKPSSDYEGIEFKFYNCYNKTVNYIYYKAVAYNSVGDKQYDYSGESTKYIEIIGPIRPGEVDFEYNNEIFYDSREKISNIRIEEMRIVFSDGTSKHFKSYSEIISHFQNANL